MILTMVCAYLSKNLFSLHSMHGSSAESAACSFHLSSLLCIEAFLIQMAENIRYEETFFSP